MDLRRDISFMARHSVIKNPLGLSLETELYYFNFILTLHELAPVLAPPGFLATFIATIELFHLSRVLESNSKRVKSEFK